MSKEKDLQIKRLSEVVNKLSAENAILEGVLREKDKQIPQKREYNFSPTALNEQEREIVGKFHGTELFDLYSKWFKFMADSNNDKLIHHHNATPEQRALYTMGVLAFDDWRLMTDMCKKIAEKNKQ